MAARARESRTLRLAPEPGSVGAGRRQNRIHESPDDRNSESAGTPQPTPILFAQLSDLARLPAAVLELRRELEGLRAELQRLRPSATDQLLSVRAAARLLDMTPAALRQAVYRGTVPVLRVGRRLRFRREDLLGRAA